MVKVTPIVSKPITTHPTTDTNEPSTSTENTHPTPAPTTSGGKITSKGNKGGKGPNSNGDEDDKEPNRSNGASSGGNEQESGALSVIGNKGTTGSNPVKPNAGKIKIYPLNEDDDEGNAAKDNFGTNKNGAEGEEENKEADKPIAPVNRVDFMKQRATKRVRKIIKDGQLVETTFFELGELNDKDYEELNLEVDIPGGEQVKKMIEDLNKKEADFDRPSQEKLRRLNQMKPADIKIFINQNTRRNGILINDEKLIDQVKKACEHLDGEAVRAGINWTAVVLKLAIIGGAIAIIALSHGGAAPLIIVPTVKLVCAITSSAMVGIKGVEKFREALTEIPWDDRKDVKVGYEQLEQLVNFSKFPDTVPSK